MKGFSAVQWQRAQRTLATARQLIATDPDSAASRAYYAAFHAITALFALRDQMFSKHSAARAALHRELIKTGQWEPELGRAYDFLMDLRETGDYGGIIQVTRDSAQTAVEKAENLLEAVRQTCPQLGQSHTDK